MDEEIDWILHRRLRDHPSWATAAELEPDPGKVAAYADDLAKKIAIFDANIGAARSVDQLVEIRSRLAEELGLVSRIRDRGGLATADLTRYVIGAASYAPCWAFTDLARALLTKRVDITSQEIKVVTPSTTEQRSNGSSALARSEKNWLNCDDAKVHSNESSPSSTETETEVLTPRAYSPLLGGIGQGISHQG